MYIVSKFVHLIRDFTTSYNVIHKDAMTNKETWSEGVYPVGERLQS